LELPETRVHLAIKSYRAISTSIERMKEVLDEIVPDCDSANLQSELHFLKGQIKFLSEQSIEYAKLLISTE